MDASSIEKAALEGFTTEQIGGSECRQILRDWFPELRIRSVKQAHGDDLEFEYRQEVDDAFAVLDGIRQALSGHERVTYVDNRASPARRPFVRGTIWDWPDEGTLENRPKDWYDTSPADVVDLTENAIPEYLKRPWLQHDSIDGAAINAILYSELAAFLELCRSGAPFGRVNWSFILSGGNAFRRLWMALAGNIVSFLAAWIMLPAISFVLFVTGFETGALIVFGLWCAYLTYRIIMIPFRWRKRSARRKVEEKASEIVGAMMKAWQFAKGRVVNPSRLRMLVLAAEDQGAVFRPILHSLIDRAIQRDATALVMRAG